MWKSVLQNVLYFTHELYPAAYSQTNWTCDGVDKALSWGAYCEKIAKQSCQNGSIQIALHNLSRRSDGTLSFNQLKVAQYHLLKSLMHNQTIEPQVQEHIHQVAKDTLGTAAVNKICQEVNQQYESYQELAAILNRTKNRNFEITLKSKLMWEVIDTVMPEQLNDNLCELVEIPGGLENLLENMKSEKRMNDAKSTIARKKVVEWLDSVLRSVIIPVHKKVVQILCGLKPAVLCHVLVTSSDLLISFLAVVHIESRKLVYKENAVSDSWSSPDSSSSLLTFKDLVNLYNILHSNRILVESVDKIVSEWCIQDGGAIWNDVVGEAKLKITKLNCE